jgi:hypothetical protein
MEQDAPYFYLVRNSDGRIVSPLFDHEHEAQSWIDGLWIEENNPLNAPTNK